MKIGNDEKETLVRAKIESFDNEKTAENDPDQENKQGMISHKKPLITYIWSQAKNFH